MMKYQLNRAWGLLLLVGFFLLPGCFGEQKKQGLVVINVLDKKFYDDCHIAGSINVPLEDIEKNIDLIAKDAEVVFYCSDYQCTGSEYAALKFKNAGFTNVHVYEGGMAEWYQAGKPIEGEHQQAYLKRPAHPVPSEEEPKIPLMTMESLAKKMGIH